MNLTEGQGMAIARYAMSVLDIIRKGYRRTVIYNFVEKEDRDGPQIVYL